MANLWVAKERLWRHLLHLRIDLDPKISLVDSFAVAVCRFARAYRCRLLPEESAFGYDETNKQTFYGLRTHLRVCWPGVVVGVDLAPANIHDLLMAEELLEGAKEGRVLGDRNYWSPDLAERFEAEGVIYWPLTSPRKGNGSPGPTGWCTSA